MGAPQNRLSELASGLQDKGWEVAVITALPNYPHGRIMDQYRHKWRSIEQINGMKVHRYWLFASNSSKALPRIISMLSFSLMAFCALPFLWRQRPDYVLVESPPLTLGITGWLLCRMSGARFVFNISDLWPLTAKALSAVSDGRFYRFLEKLEHFLYRRADLCTGQSDEIIAHLQAAGAKRTLLFRNGVDLNRFTQGALRPPFQPRPRLIYAGLLGVAQGILKICQNLDFQAIGLEFHIYGAGPERQQLEAFLAQNPGRGIFFHGPVQSQEIPALLQTHDAALIALTKHIQGAVPSKIYEAMAAGLPIFFSGTGEAARIIEQYQIGWTNVPDDFQQLALNLDTFLQNQAQRNLFQQNSLQAARHFSRSAQIEQLDRCLKETWKQ